MKTSHFLILLCFVSAAELFAQRSFRSIRENSIPHLYLGVETNVGTRSFGLTSNLTEYQNGKVAAQGMSVGLLFGSEKFIAKAKQGFYQSSSIMKQRQAALSETGLAINIFPLQLLNGRRRYIEPYIIAGADRNTVKLYGSSTTMRQWMEIAAANQLATQSGANGNQTGNSSSGSGDPMNPDECHDSHTTSSGTQGSGSSQTVNPNQQQSSTQGVDGNSLSGTEEETNEFMLGSLRSLRANAGVGIRFHVPSRRFFLNLFSEVKYGFVIKQHVTHPVLDGTRAGRQLMINVGISTGLRSFF